jgi:pyruvate dehydrogenase E1 component alpha subunit
MNIPSQYTKVRDVKITSQELIDFEDRVKLSYESGKVKGPIHLSKNNEIELIEIFQYIHNEDWVFSAWRNHYHALLKGLSSNFVKKKIIQGRSMNITCLQKKFFTSSIVGGILPIALGIALSLKLKKKKSKVWVFIGDMTYETGVFYECYKYSTNFKLPIKYIVEDNGMSTNTSTEKAWGKKMKVLKDIIYYKYKRKYPHHGIGKWVLF